LTLLGGFRGWKPNTFFDSTKQAPKVRLPLRQRPNAGSRGLLLPVWAQQAARTLAATAPSGKSGDLL